MAHLRRSTGRLLLPAAPLLVYVAWPGAAVADPPPNRDDASALPTPSTVPPPTGNTFVQYGVAFTTEVVASPGRICASPIAPCIFGSGGGIVFPRIGWRDAGPWYIGGAYEISKQEANTLYRLAILQQLRGEARYYFLSGQILTPFVGASAGVAGYGDEWALDTFGPDGALTLGVEAQVSRGTVVGLALNYRAIYAREGSVAQLFGLDLQLEVRDPY
jgi:hypothetical protein